MKKRELKIAFYQLISSIHTRSQDVPRPMGANMATLLATLYDAFSKKQVLKLEVNRGTSILEMADIKYDKANKEYQVLLNFCDSDLADYRLKSVKTRKSKGSGKTDDEGIDKSTHILIKVTSTNQAAVIATQDAGISMTKLEKFFGIALRTLSKDPAYAAVFQQPHPNGVAGETYNVRYVFECKGQLDTTLQDALNGGSLNLVQLVKHEGGQQFDAQGKLKKKATVLQLQPEIRKGFSVAGLEIALRERPPGYDTVVVDFTDDEGNPGRTTLQVGAMEQAFTRRERIKFDTDLVQSYTSISPTIIARMREHL